MVRTLPLPILASQLVWQALHALCQIHSSCALTAARGHGKRHSERLEAGCCAYVQRNATRTPDPAGINGAGSKDASPLSKTHVLPVSQDPEPETINILDKETQGVLRKGNYNFARCTACRPSHYLLVSCLTTYKPAHRVSCSLHDEDCPCRGDDDHCM